MVITKLKKKYAKWYVKNGKLQKVIPIITSLYEPMYIGEARVEYYIKQGKSVKTAFQDGMLSVYDIFAFAHLHNKYNNVYDAMRELDPEYFEHEKTGKGLTAACVVVDEPAAEKENK